jgi:hypothetical protein
LVQDQLPMMPINQVKGKAHVLRTGWAHLGINPKPGVDGMVMMIGTIYHSRSTSPTDGILCRLLRSHTAITSSLTTSHLSPREGATMVMRPQAQTILQVRGSMGSRQDSLATTPMCVSMEHR